MHRRGLDGLRQAVRDAGILVSGESLADLVTVMKVQVDADGERTVTDGPFAETREVLGGFYLWSCAVLRP
jgi:hypothetical protein